MPKDAAKALWRDCFTRLITDDDSDTTQRPFIDGYKREIARTNALDKAAFVRSLHEQVIDTIDRVPEDRCKLNEYKYMYPWEVNPNTYYKRPIQYYIDNPTPRPNKELRDRTAQRHTRAYDIAYIQKQKMEWTAEFRQTMNDDDFIEVQRMVLTPEERADPVIRDRLVTYRYKYLLPWERDPYFYTKSIQWFIDNPKRWNRAKHTFKSQLKYIRDDTCSDDEPEQVCTETKPKSPSKPVLRPMHPYYTIDPFSIQPKELDITGLLPTAAALLWKALFEDHLSKVGFHLDDYMEVYQLPWEYDPLFYKRTLAYYLSSPRKH